jgi:hypothetical protein
MKKLFLLLICVLFTTVSYTQITVKQFNADWNKANTVTWLGKLSDCSVKYIDVAKYPSYQKKYKLVVFPTIIIFDHGEEVKRYQADLSFKINATRSEIQEEIDNLIMSDF